MLLTVAFFCCLTSVLCQETLLESNLKWFFNKMQHDSGFRNYMIGSAALDELSQTLNYLEHPPTDCHWLVILDPQNWPESKHFGVMLESSQKTCQKYKPESARKVIDEKFVIFPNFHTWTNSASFNSNFTIQCLVVSSKIFSPFQRLLVASDFDENQFLENTTKQSHEESNYSSWQPRMFSDNWNPNEIGFREAADVTGDSIQIEPFFEEKKPESTELIEVIELGNKDKTLDENNQGGKYDTAFYIIAFYIILSLLVAFFVILLLMLVIYCIVRKKNVNHTEKSSSFVKANNDTELINKAIDEAINEVEVVKKAMEKPLPYPIKAPTVADFPKEFAKAYTKEEALSLGIPWDFPSPEKFKTPTKTPKSSINTENDPDFYDHIFPVPSTENLKNLPKTPQTSITEENDQHHPDFYNHTPLSYKSPAE